VHNHAIVDTHLHIWDTRRLDYPWLQGSEKLNRPHTIEDFQRASSGLPITRIVFLQCDCAPRQRADEIAYVKEAAEREPRLQAIVPFAPVEEGEAVRAELRGLAADPMIKGVRRIVQSEPDPAFCLGSDFVRGVQILGELGLHFEICISQTQLESAVELVRMCPGTRFILDHVGKPDIRAGRLSPWREQIAAMADLPNVVCKVSGMVTEADHGRWTIDDLRPFAETVFERFGFDRVLFGSDWPVATLASSYTRWVETLEALAAARSDDEKDRLFNRNALAFYRLA
jgi:L-fuconolactonase